MNDNQPFSVPLLMSEVDPIHLGHYTQIAQSMASQQIQNSLANAASQGITPEQWTRFVVDQANLQAAQNQKGASNQTNQNPDEDTPDQTTNPITPTNPVTPTNQVPQPPAPTQPTDPQTQQAADQLQTAINTMPGIPAHVKAELSDPEMLATIVAGFLGGGFQSLSHAALSAYQGAQQRADRQNQANQDTYDNQMEQWRARNDNSDYNEPAIQQPDPNQPNPTAGNSPETMAANRRNAAIAQGVTDVHGRTWLNPNAIAKLGQDTKYFSNPDAANWAQSLVEQQVANRMMNDPATAAAGFGRLRREIQRQKSIVLLHRDYLLSQNDGQVPTPNSPLYPQWQDMGQKLDQLSRNMNLAQQQFRTMNPKLDINQAMSADDGGSIFAPQMSDPKPNNSDSSDQDEADSPTNSAQQVRTGRRRRNGKR